MNRPRPSGFLRPDRRPAFTLMELLIVVALLAILLAALLPALRRAKDIARRLTCSSHLRQIAMGWHSYLDGHDGRFYKGRNANTDYGGWQGLSPGRHPTPRPLNPYLGLPEVIESREQGKVFRCPGDDGRIPAAVCCYYEAGTSYQTNLFLIGPYSLDLPDEALKAEVNKLLPETRLSQIGNPSEILLLGDYYWWLQFDPQLPAHEEDVWHRRLGRYNMAFVDTHVELVEVHKGLLIGPGYRILPFPQLYHLACQGQGGGAPGPGP